MHPCRLKLQSGFTLVESVVVLVVVGVLSAYAVMRNSSPAVYSLASQAQTLASDLRHVQTLATTWGRSLCVSVAGGVNGTYSVSYFNAGPPPQCNASPVINPTTGASFSVSLQKNASLSLSGLLTLGFDSQGKPIDTTTGSVATTASQYVLSAGSGSNSGLMTVTVAPLTGYVSVP